MIRRVIWRVQGALHEWKWQRRMEAAITESRRALDRDFRELVRKGDLDPDSGAGAVLLADMWDIHENYVATQQEMMLYGEVYMTPEGKVIPHDEVYPEGLADALRTDLPDSDPLDVVQEMYKDGTLTPGSGI